MSTILEQEWPNAQYCAFSLHSITTKGESKFCFLGKIYDLAGAQWAHASPVNKDYRGNFHFFPITTPTIDKWIERYGISEDQLIKLELISNYKGRDAVIKRLKDSGF